MKNNISIHSNHNNIANKIEIMVISNKGKHFIDFEFLTCCLNTLVFSKTHKFIIYMSLQKDRMISGKMSFWYIHNCVFSCHKYITWQFRNVTHGAASWHIILRKIRSWLLYSSCWYSVLRDKHFQLHRAHVVACLNCLLASPTFVNNCFQNKWTELQYPQYTESTSIGNTYVHVYIHTYIHTMKELPRATVVYEQDITPLHDNLSLQIWALAQWSFAIKHLYH